MCRLYSIHIKFLVSWRNFILNRQMLLPKLCSMSCNTLLKTPEIVLCQTKMDYGLEVIAIDTNRTTFGKSKIAETIFLNDLTENDGDDLETVRQFDLKIEKEIRDLVEGTHLAVVVTMSRAVRRGQGLHLGLASICPGSNRVDSGFCDYSACF